jgi:uncharacterized protein (TIGR00369 family)
VSANERLPPVPVLGFAELEALVRDCAYHVWLGVRLVSLDAAGVVIEMPWREEFVSDTQRRYTHGGILASLIDLSADYAIAAQLGRGVPTVDLRVDYHRPAFPGRLVAHAKVVKLGSTLASAEAHIFDENSHLVASGRGAFLTLTHRSMRT